MSYSFWRPQPWRPGALAPLTPLATPLDEIARLELDSSALHASLSSIRPTLHQL